MFRSDIETLAEALLDEHIEKGLAKESKSKIERIEKALSHDPFRPVEVGMDSPYYSPYKVAPEGGFLPYSSQHWADQGKDQSSYLTTDQFYERYGEVQQAITRFRGFARSLENDLMKAGAVPIGTVHQYTDGLSYKKFGEGDWRPVTQGRFGVRVGGKSKVARTDIERQASGKEQMNRISAAMKNKKDHEATRQAAVQEAMKNVRDVIGKLFDGPLPKDVAAMFDQSSSTMRTIRRRGSKESTADFHKNEDGEYSLERKNLHDQIISKRLDLVKSSKKPIAILTGGGSGSGKSSVLKAALANMKDDLVHIDADDIKKDIPEYNEMTKENNPDAAALAHDESSDLSSELINRAIESNKPFVYDSTMKNVEKFKKLIDKLKKSGFEVHIVFAYCDPDTAKQRADMRAKKTGRKVPDSIIEESHKGAINGLNFLHELADSTTVYNTGGEPPPKVAAKRGGRPPKTEKTEHYKEMESRGMKL